MKYYEKNLIQFDIRKKSDESCVLKQKKIENIVLCDEINNSENGLNQYEVLRIFDENHVLLQKKIENIA